MPYSGNPAASEVDWIRFTIRDTNATPYFTDLEVAAVLAEQGDKYKAAGVLLKRWVIDLLAEPNFTIGSFSEDHGRTLADLLAEANKLLSGATVGLYAGGISVADTEAIEADEDRPAMAFDFGMDRNPNA